MGPVSRDAKQVQWLSSWAHRETYGLKKEIENLEKDKKELKEKIQSLQVKVDETSMNQTGKFLFLACVEL